MEIDRALADKVNAAICQHIGSWLGSEAAERIANQYGFATRTLVQQLYQQALTQPVDWATQTLPEYLAQVAGRLKTAYPFLTEESTRRLVNCAAYSWK